MGLTKTLKKVFKIRKKRDAENEDEDRNAPVLHGSQAQSGLNRGRSIRGGIYEPYRQHFPLKSQMTEYNQYGQANYPQVQGFNQEGPQATYGPKLVTSTENTNNNYGYHQPLGRRESVLSQSARYPQSRLNRASSDASVCSYRPNNYQAFNHLMNQRFGSNLSINQAGQSTGGESYENHLLGQRRPNRSNSIQLPGQYDHMPPHRGASGLSRQGSVSSMNHATFPQSTFASRPRRPSSAIIPPRAMSDAGSVSGLMRPGRPSSAQGSFLALDNQNYDVCSVIPPAMSGEYPSSLTSSFVAGQTQRVMSPVGSFYGSPCPPLGMSPDLQTPFDVQQQSSFALHQLRSSQANLQQALRVQEDLSRQGGTAKPAELDATMKIMQTCLDMLDSISGLVERSTTPVPQGVPQLPQTIQIPHRIFDPQPLKKNFINHQKNLKPMKSALKQRIPTTTSAFEAIQKNNEEIQEPSPGLSDSSEGFYGACSQDETSRLESPALFQTSPGPSVLSEDSGYGLQIRADPILTEVAKKDIPATATDTETDNELAEAALQPMLSSLSQLKIGSTNSL